MSSPTKAGYQEFNIWIIFLGLIIVMVLLSLDVFSDYMGWFNLSHFLIEVVSVLLLLGLILHSSLLLLKFRVEAAGWKKKAGQSEEDAKMWRKKARELLNGLGEVIDQQFEAWHFTKAEKEIGVLMLKGLSFKEVAEIRNTSEKTVRQQATEIYKKAMLKGRTEFSAFFLEDLLLPHQPAKSQKEQ